MLYADLVASIQDYVENTFGTVSSTSTTNLVDVFIKQAEQRIFNSVQLPELRITTTGTVVAGSQYLNCPADFLSAFSLAVTDFSGNTLFLLNKDVNYIREAYPQVSYQAMPQHYAIFGPQTGNPLYLQFILGPTPDQTYAYELQYYPYPQSITTAGETWLGDNFDSALLWGSVVEAYHYLKGDADLMGMYQKRYDDALALLKQLGDGKNRQDMYRSGQVRYPVQ